MSLYPPNEKNRKFPKKLKYTAWDIETDYPNNPKKVIGLGFFNGKYYKDWFNNDNIFDMFLGECLQSKYYGWSHYAHFGGKFDFLFLLDTLKKYDYEYDIIDANGRILSLDVIINRKKSKIIHFRDSYALIPQSLSNISKGFKKDLKHVKLEYDFKNPDKNKYSMKEYLYNDVLTLFESISIFENIINKYNGEIKITIASTSLDVFKNGYLNTVINSLNVLEADYKNRKIELHVEDIVRNMYYGGRTEIFKRFINNGYFYDINSSYPYAMLQPMPITKPMFVLPENINYKKDNGYVYCDIECYNNDIVPLIPYRKTVNNRDKLLFPLGKWKTWLNLDMYRKAIELGYNITVKYGFIFGTDYIFNDFVKDFYKLRFSNDTMYLVSKLILNNTYGKFAQKRFRKHIIKFLKCNDISYCNNSCPHKDDFGECVLTVYDLDNNLYTIESYSESKHIIPSISAHITCLAQLHLYSFIEQCGKNNIYYTDTDSLVTDKKLKTNDDLGGLKLEYEIDSGAFLLPKTYYLKGYDTKKQEFKDKIVLKGFTSKVYTFDDFCKAIITDNLSGFKYVENRLFGFRESIRKNSDFVTYDTKNNSLKSLYDKRIVLSDKINTKPIIINE